MAVLVVLVVADCVAAQPAPLNSSVLIFDEATLARAPAMVDRAADLGNTRVMVVVTLHCRLTPELQVMQYGLVRDRRLEWETPKPRDNFRPMNDTVRAEFTARMVEVFRRAARHGMDLAILPHLDAYGEVEAWRNHFDFDPLEIHGGESYETALITPIIDALGEATGPTTAVQFSLSGEMGRSLFGYAEYYHEIALYIRHRLKPRVIEIGVSLNHNEVAGGHAMSEPQRQSLQRLVNTCDYVGLSHYRPFTPPAAVEHFTDVCDAFVDGLGDRSIKLPPGTPLHFSEVALGGGTQKKALALESIALEPWEGTGDPAQSAWRFAGAEQLRVGFHTRLLEFLSKQPARHRVSAAYLWSEGSWDPQGIDNQAFRDDEIVKRIAEHNKAVARPR